MCRYKNTRHTFCRNSQNATAHACSLSSCPCRDPHVPHAESCKQATCAHVCHKNAIGLLMLGEVHRESGKGRILSCILQISVVESTDFCSQEGHSVGRVRDTVAGTTRGSSNGHCFHGWIMHSSVYFLCICERNPLHCVLSKHFSLFVHFFNLSFRCVSQ